MKHIIATPRVEMSKSEILQDNFLICIVYIKFKENIWIICCDTAVIEIIKSRSLKNSQFAAYRKYNQNKMYVNSNEMCNILKFCAVAYELWNPRESC